MWRRKCNNVITPEECNGMRQCMGILKGFNRNPRQMIVKQSSVMQCKMGCTTQWCIAAVRWPFKRCGWQRQGSSHPPALSLSGQMKPRWRWERFVVCKQHSQSQPSLVLYTVKHTVWHTGTHCPQLHTHCANTGKSSCLQTHCRWDDKICQTTASQHLLRPD